MGECGGQRERLGAEAAGMGADVSAQREESALVREMIAMSCEEGLCCTHVMHDGLVRAVGRLAARVLLTQNKS